MLMPGLTDAHCHMTVAPNSPEALTGTGLMYANTVVEARRTLMRGFTVCRFAKIGHPFSVIGDSR